MGKIKRERQKFHIAAESKPAANVNQKPAPKYKPIKAQLDAVENIFSGITIQLDNINKFEEVAPTPPVEPKVNEEKTVKPSVAEVDEKPSEKTKIDFSKTTTEPGKHLTKKEKMALKHQKLMEKLDVTQKARLKHKKNNQKSKQNDNGSSQILAVSKSEFRSLLTPAAVTPAAAVKPSKEVKPSKSVDAVPKNVFSIPLLNDDLPSLNSIFELKSKRNNNNAHKITKKSKNIGKKVNSKKNFVANYNFLKKAMAMKKKKIC